MMKADSGVTCLSGSRVPARSERVVDVHATGTLVHERKQQDGAGPSSHRPAAEGPESASLWSGD